MNSPLHLAAANGFPDVVEAIIGADGGANRFAKNEVS